MEEGIPLLQNFLFVEGLMMAILTGSSTLAWKIPWAEEPVHGVAKSQTQWETELNWLSVQCEIIPHCSFDLHFSNNEQCWASFHLFISHLYVFFANKGPSSQSHGFSSNHVWMWELNYKENWALKNLCFWTVVLEKTLESPLDCKEVQPINPKGNQSWIFIGRTDAEAETPIVWPPDAKNWVIGKDWFWEILKAGEGDNRRWDGWMVSPTLWTWVWVSSRSWWWTGSLACCSYGVTKSQQLNWTECTVL